MHILLNNYNITAESGLAIRKSIVSFQWKNIICHKMQTEILSY